MNSSLEQHASVSLERQSLRSIRSFHLVTADLCRLVGFYRDVLGFGVVGPARPIDQDEMALLGIRGSGTRQVLALGAQSVAVESFDAAGRPYPPSVDAASLRFQHLALVVDDIAASYAQLREVAPISLEGPQRLPPASGGAKAFKFRDPDGHPLELIEFSAAKKPFVWRALAAQPGQIAIGIDHSAISVSDLGASVRFYEGLGLAAEQGTVNVGPAQENLDCLQNVRVSVKPMRPAGGTSHLELLGYERSRSDGACGLRPNDVAATRICWDGDRAALLVDPDGHLQQVAH